MIRYLPRIMLLLALIFLVGGVVAGIISVRNRQGDNVTGETAAPPLAPAPTAPSPAPTTPIAPKPESPLETRKKVIRYYTFYETYQTVGLDSSEAWARAGVRDDGTTYAESFAR